MSKSQALKSDLIEEIEVTITHSKRRTVLIGITAGVLAAGGLGVGTAYAATTYLGHGQQAPAGAAAQPAANAAPGTGAGLAAAPAAGTNAGTDPAPAAGQNAAGNTSTHVAPASATSLPSTPQAYAKEAFEAWRTQQTARLKQLTDPAAYQQFQAIPRQTSGRVWYFANCDAGAGQVYCTFAAYPTGDTVVVKLPNGPSTAHAIVNANFGKGGHSKLPARTVPAYSAAAATAFSNGDYDLLAHVSTQSGFKALVAQPAPGAQTWRAPVCDGGAGQVYCTVKSAEGRTLVFHSDNNVPGGHFPLVDVQSYTKS
jgi:hypothetical protein